MAALSPELCAWLVPGLAGAMTAVDARQQPQTARVWAVRVSEGRDVIEVYVLRSAAFGLLEGVTVSGRAALNLIEVSTYRSRMFKGRCRVATAPADAAFLEENLAALDRAFHGVGMAPGSAQRMLLHSDAPRDMVALGLSVESVFDQSPKRGAGARI